MTSTPKPSPQVDFGVSPDPSATHGRASAGDDASAQISRRYRFVPPFSSPSQTMPNNIRVSPNVGVSQGFSNQVASSSRHPTLNTELPSENLPQTNDAFHRIVPDTNLEYLGGAKFAHPTSPFESMSSLVAADDDSTAHVDNTLLQTSHAHSVISLQQEQSPGMELYPMHINHPMDVKSIPNSKLSSSTTTNSNTLGDVQVGNNRANFINNYSDLLVNDAPTTAGNIPVVGRPTFSDFGDNTDDVSSDDNAIYLCLLWSGGKLGAAYYDMNSCELHLLTDTDESPTFYLLQNLVHQLNPAVVITSAKEDGRVVNAINRVLNARDAMHVTGVDGNNNDTSTTSNTPSTSQMTTTTSGTGDEVSPHGLGVGGRGVNATNTLVANNDGGNKTNSSSVVSATTSSTGSNHKALLLLPSVFFSPSSCKRRILMTNVPSMPKDVSEDDRRLYMESVLDFNATNMVRSAGGLLKHLDKLTLGLDIDQDSEQQQGGGGRPTSVPVAAFKPFSLGDLVIMDHNSMSALQVFHKDSHPSVYKSNTGAAKEGMSLFGLLNRCRSTSGHKQFKLLCLRPTNDRATLEERYAAVEYFSDYKNADIIKTMQDCLRNMKYISKILMKMETAQASVSEWQTLYKTAYNSVLLGDVCRSERKHAKILDTLARHSTDRVYEIASLISKVINFQESVVEQKFCVQVGIDAELDRKKEMFAHLPEYMTQVARNELQLLPPEVASCNIIYIPQIGYLLAIPRTSATVPTPHHLVNMMAERGRHVSGSNPPEPHTHAQGPDDGGGLKFVFESNNTDHYRSPRTREMDNLLGDTQCDIIDHEASIMYRLQNTILKCAPDLISLLEDAAQLDCLISLGLAAKHQNYVRPRLNTDRYINITGGRHPLQELCCSPFVSNECKSGVEEMGRITVVTGANASGKSVYMKQIALIVYMAHIGSFVPAECADICLVDRIFTRIQSQDSVSTALSTFMVDVNQVANAINNATSDSLVIIDEFGKGTNSEDGIALLASTISHWCHSGVGGGGSGSVVGRGGSDSTRPSPHVFISTHFHMLEHALRGVDRRLTYGDGGEQVNYMCMSTYVEEQPDSLVFLYEVIPGLTSHSHALAVAHKAQLPDPIITRAKHIAQLLREGRPITNTDTNSHRVIQRCSEVVDKFLEMEVEGEGSVTDMSRHLSNITSSLSSPQQQQHDDVTTD